MQSKEALVLAHVFLQVSAFQNSKYQSSPESTYLLVNQQIVSKALLC